MPQSYFLHGVTAYTSTFTLEDQSSRRQQVRRILYPQYSIDIMLSATSKSATPHVSRKHASATDTFSNTTSCRKIPHGGIGGIFKVSDDQ